VGFFGDRFGEIASRFGAEVSTLDFAPGTAVDPGRLRAALEGAPDVKAVLVTHNETSTGVANDLEAIASVAKGEFGKLLLVDGISSVCSLPLLTDDWGCDVVATASQKGWMLPPGLAFLSFSEAAWEAHANATMPRYYFDVAQYSHYYELGQPPYTPALSVIFALDAALERILAEGIDGLYERHAAIAQMTRDGLKALGLSIFPDERVASDTVTAVAVPEGVDAERLLAIVREEHGVVLAAGQGPQRGVIFRIGHMGQVTRAEIQEVLDALADALPKAGFAPSGAATM
jgi:aspartate aminotransferase-like enzyme